IVRQHRVGTGRAACFPDTNTDASAEELPVIARQAGCDREGGPDDETDADDDAAALAVYQPGEGKAENDVEDREGDAGEEGDVGIGEMQLPADRLEHGGDRVAVANAQRVHHAQRDRDIPALRDRGGIRRNAVLAGGASGMEVDPCLAHPRVSSRMRSAAFSATIRVGALMFPEVTAGKTEASMTRRWATPCTRRRGSTTELVACGPIAQVPDGWNTEPARRRKSWSTSSSEQTRSPGNSSDSITVASGWVAAIRRSMRAPS